MQVVCGFKHKKVYKNLLILRRFEVCLYLISSSNVHSLAENLVIVRHTDTPDNYSNQPLCLRRGGFTCTCISTNSVRVTVLQNYIYMYKRKLHIPSLNVKLPFVWSKLLLNRQFFNKCDTSTSTGVLTMYMYIHVQVKVLF